MLTIKMWCFLVANEERCSIGVGASVGHGENAGVSVGHPDLFIGKLGTISTLSFLSFVVLHDLATLHHEAGDDSLKNSLFVMDIHTKLSSAKETEIFTRLRQMVLEKFHNYALFLITGLPFGANLDIYEDLDVFHVKVWHPTINLRLSLPIETVL